VDMIGLGRALRVPNAGQIANMIAHLFGPAPMAKLCSCTFTHNISASRAVWSVTDAHILDV
jgi:hypothetical protein